MQEYPLGLERTRIEDGLYEVTLDQRVVGHVRLIPPNERGGLRGSWEWRATTVREASGRRATLTECVLLLGDLARVVAQR